MDSAASPKSSIVGPLIEAAGGAYFNPDLYARALRHGAEEIMDGLLRTAELSFE